MTSQKLQNHPLGQGAAYGIIVGLGIPFAVAMCFITLALQRYHKEKVNAAGFATAGRGLSSGLVAVSVIITWTWVPAIFVSSSQAYNNGVFGPISHCTGAVAQMFVFAAFAVELKRKAPHAYTYLEVIRLRHGTLAHFVYIFYAIGANIMSMGMLVAGCVETAQELAGMNTIAGCFLVPLGAAIYTSFGGLKASMISGYIHLIIMFVVINIFAFEMYASSKLVGSIGKFYDLVKDLAVKEPVPGNKGGSYLTMRSDTAAQFMVINLISCFATGFLDTAFWNKAIAAGPRSLFPGYFMAGLVWFSIPWVLATSMGLGGKILEKFPSFPTYPEPMTQYQNIAGMSIPFSSVAIMGKGGGGTALMMVYMASSSTMSGEMVSVSTIWTYDIYRTYINRKASEKALLFNTHVSLNVFTLAMIGFSIGLVYGAIGPGFLFQLLGILLSPAVVTVGLNLFWSGINKWSTILAPPIGTACGLAAWIGITGGLNNNVFEMGTLIGSYPMMGGNLVAVGTPVIVVAICQLIFGHQHYDFKKLRNHNASCDDPLPDTKNEASSAKPSQISLNSNISPENASAEKNVVTSERKPGDSFINENGELEENVAALVKHNQELKEDERILKKHSKQAIVCAVFMLISLLVVFPIPMYASNYIFSKHFFDGWVIVSLIWMIGSGFILLVVPPWQGRRIIADICVNLYWDITGQTTRMRAWQDDNPDRMYHARDEEDASFQRQAR